MKHGFFRSGMVLLAAGFSLSGCVLFDDTRRSGPDEFGVVSRAPLSQPPDFSLRPPRAGAKRPNEVTPRDDAQKKLLSDSPPPVTLATPAASVPNIAVPTLSGVGSQPANGRVPAGTPAVVKGAEGGDGISPGERALLQQAGATQADSKIRTVVDRESGRVREEDSLVDKLVFWRTAKSKGAAIDPSGEAERLNRNAALGQSGGGKPKPVDGK